MTKAEEQIADEIVAPVILKLLKQYSASDMTKAINENINLSKGLEQAPQYLTQLQMLTRGVPYVEKLAKKVRQKKWIMWFVNNAMQHKRADLYNQIIYNPKGTKYIIKEIRKITKLIFA